MEMNFTGNIALARKNDPDAVMRDLCVMLFEENIPPEQMVVLAHMQEEVKHLRAACRSVAVSPS
jgi:hypothetical protein